MIRQVGVTLATIAILAVIVGVALYYDGFTLAHCWRVGDGPWHTWTVFGPEQSCP